MKALLGKAERYDQVFEKSLCIRHGEHKAEFDFLSLSCLTDWL